MRLKSWVGDQTFAYPLYPYPGRYHKPLNPLLLYSSDPLPPLFYAGLPPLGLDPLFLRRRRRSRRDPSFFFCQPPPYQLLHPPYHFSLVRQLCPVHLRPHPELPIRIDPGSQLFLQQLLFIIREEGGIPDRKIALHHRLDFIDVLTAFAAASGGPENNFFYYLHLHIIFGT